MSKYTAPTFEKAFFHPRYWLTLTLISTMYLVSWLPYFIQFRLGQGLGRLGMGLVKKRGKTIERNIELCFPDMSTNEREALIQKNIDNTGLAMFETGMAWFWPDLRVERHVQYEGLEYLQQLEKQGKGVLLIAVHSLNLELGARAFGLKVPGVGGVPSKYQSML